MTATSVEAMLERLCAVPALVPDYWNVFEPIDLPFQPANVGKIVDAFVPSSPRIRSAAFFLRDQRPSFLLTIDLRLGPVQWTTAHNTISFHFQDEWSGGEHVLARYLPRSVLPRLPDYVSIPDWSQDKERYKDFQRSYTPREFVALISQRSITAPFGPYGCLADVHWFNYFGRVYVETIGKLRLMGAGWARVEEIGDGLACYATEHIDDPNSRRRRDNIAKAIEEFVWTPGCKPEQKQIPTFDYSEQFAALPADVAQQTRHTSGPVQVQFAGLTAEEHEKAVRLLEQTGVRTETREDPKGRPLK